MLRDQLRSQIRAGFSPYLHFRRVAFAGGGSEARFEGLDWESSLRGHWALEAGVPIRLPGQLLDGDQITFLRLRPSEYADYWKRFDLAGYFSLRDRLLGERACPECLKRLNEDTHEARRYCSPACKAAAKMRRYRDRSQEDLDKLKKTLNELFARMDSRISCS